MNKDHLTFYNRLHEEKEEVTKSLDNLRREKSDSMDMYYTELSGYDNHPADMGTEVYMKEQDKGVEDQLKETLVEIDQSLEELKIGNYGVCNTCHKDINKEILELIPYLKNCIECSSELSPPVQFRQLSNEEIPGNLFGTIKRDHVYYDGEDTLQEVLQYNIVENDPSFSTGDNMGVMDEDNEGVEDIENISQEYYDKTLR